jgi:hypothetical protein
MRFLKHAVLSICIVGGLSALAVFFFTLQNPGSIDRAAVKRIQVLCGQRSDCEVTLKDIFKGDWDTYYQFGYPVSQADVDRALHSHSVRVSDLQTIHVFEKGGQIVRKGYGDTGQGQPLADELEFSGSYGDGVSGWVKYPAEARFKVVACSTKEGGKLGGPYGGTYYLLILLPIRSGYLTECDLPFG